MDPTTLLGIGVLIAIVAALSFYSGSEYGKSLDEPDIIIQQPPAQTADAVIPPATGTPAPSSANQPSSQPSQALGYDVVYRN